MITAGKEKYQRKNLYNVNRTILEVLMIKLIASDLDGTIIDANGNCDPAIAETIRRVRKLGVKFAICSGRPISSVKPLVKN